MTFITKTGQKIIADNLEAFEVIRKQYFPQIPSKDWIVQPEEKA